jgi:hypothetical protein
MQVLRRFDLEDHFAVDDHVESLMRDVGAVVLNENVQLPIDTVAAMEQLAFERSRAWTCSRKPKPSARCTV